MTDKQMGRRPRTPSKEKGSGVGRACGSLPAQESLMTLTK